MLRTDRAMVLPFLLLWAACPDAAAHTPMGGRDASLDADAAESGGPCPVGTAGERCEPCPAGSFCAGGTAPMALCPTNTFDDDQDPKTACVAASSCSAGSYVVLPYSRVSDTRCAPCPSGSFSTERNARSCTDFTKCTSSEFISEAGSATRDLVCKPRRVCKTDEYESVKPTLTSDRECIVYTICTPGQYVSMTPTIWRNRGCTDCATGFYTANDNAGECLPWRECAANEVERRAPSNTNDRECECQTSSEEDAGSGVCADP